MSAINKLVASAASLSNELTLAAANINLDFTLIKLEAPKEYKAVHDSLTQARRDDAEGGALHRTARKLGALFEGIPPTAENLLSAYGKRVTEICEQTNIDPSHTGEHGIFSRFVGADAGSLWAAATSGTSAIAIHLLACLIAEMFDGSQAVALWYQLIERRKQELVGSVAGEMDQVKGIARAMACKQEFSREELALWDNSARSWGQTANTATAKQREKALLNSEKAGMAVNKLTDPYNSVMEAWVDAMTSMNSLIAGTPQRVRNGAVLLAMTSWHLYPDLCVLSDVPWVKHQKDALLPSSGVLTIDLENSDEAAGGVSRSLPLSYMRYYGEPVVVERVVGPTSNRISMDQFRFVLLGCVVSTWSHFTGSFEVSMDLMLKILEALRWPERSRHSKPSVLRRVQSITSRTSWIGMLLTAVEDFADSSGIERLNARKLINHGRRHAGFLAELASHAPPFFGLHDMPTMFSLLNGPEPRIKYLRVFAKHLGLSSNKCVIRYDDGGGQSVFATIKPVEEDFGSSELDGFVRRPTSASMRGKHFRWIIIKQHGPPCRCGDKCFSKNYVEQQWEKMKTSTRLLQSFKQARQKGFVVCGCLERGVTCSPKCHDWKHDKERDCLHGKIKKYMESIAEAGEHCLPACERYSNEYPRTDMVDFANSLGFGQALTQLSLDARHVTGGSETYVSLRFCVGDSTSAEILSTEPMAIRGTDPWANQVQVGGASVNIGQILTPKVIEETFEAQHYNYDKLAEWFTTGLRLRYVPFTKALRGCAAAVEIYARLPEATVDPSIVTKMVLASTSWIKSDEGYNPSLLRMTLSRAAAFGCIATFESGRDVDIRYLWNVFAMTSGNSIFVANPMLADPYEIPVETEIKYVRGNIGKPGLSLLVPPPAPRMRQTDPERWELLNHKRFTGKIEDNFWKTSMHLSLTQYQPSLRSRGEDDHFIDENTVIRETLVQVYDGSTWICDLDILSTLRNDDLYRVVCNHTENTPEGDSLENFKNTFEIVSVDTWEEIFTPPLDPAISLMRTAGNWLGRLAAVGVSVRLDRATIVLPNTRCWSCTALLIKDLELYEEHWPKIVLIL